MGIIFNILLLLFLFGYGVVQETQMSIKAICGIRGAAEEYRALDTSGYGSNKPQHKKSPAIEFLGTNGGHQRTLEFQKKVDKPFTVLMFDAHSDAKPYSGKLHCGNWVNSAFAQNPHLNRIVTIGVSKGIRFEMAQTWCNYELLKSGKQVIFPATSVKSYFKDEKIPAAVYALSDGCEFDGLGKFFGAPGYYLKWKTPSYDAVKKFIPAGDEIYITIDLDVLKDVRTPYGSGRMGVSAVTGIIKQVENGRKIAGVDICGTDDVSVKAGLEEILKCF